MLPHVTSLLKSCLKLYTTSIPSLGCVITLIQPDCLEEEENWETEMKLMSFIWKATHRCHTPPPDPSPSGRGASWTEATSRPKQNRRATCCSTGTRTPRRPHPGQSTAGRIHRRSRWVSSWRDLQAKLAKRTQWEDERWKGRELFLHSGTVQLALIWLFEDINLSFWFSFELWLDFLIFFDYLKIKKTILNLGYFWVITIYTTAKRLWFQKHKALSQLPSSLPKHASVRQALPDPQLQWHWQHFLLYSREHHVGVI